MRLAITTITADPRPTRDFSFREPGGVLVEIAAPARFAVDDDPAAVGEELRVPRMPAHPRERLEATPSPLVNPRAARRDKVCA